MLFSKNGMWTWCAKEWGLLFNCVDFWSAEQKLIKKGKFFVENGGFCEFYKSKTTFLMTFCSQTISLKIPIIKTLCNSNYSNSHPLFVQSLGQGGQMTVVRIVAPRNNSSWALRPIGIQSWIYSREFVRHWSPSRFQLDGKAIKWVRERQCYFKVRAKATNWSHY
jgi:hypothetical protein